jgi:kumamolisin
VRKKPDARLLRDVRPPLWWITLAGLFVVVLTSEACSAAVGVGSPLTEPPSFLDRVITRSTDLGPLERRLTVSFVVHLHDASAARREADLLERSRPGSQRYGEVLTPERAAIEYGPDPIVVATARAILGRYGMSTQWTNGLHSLWAKGSVQSVERTLGLSVHRYVAPDGSTFYASTREPRVPDELLGLVAAIGRISTYQPTGLNAVHRAVPPDGITPEGLALAYDYKQLRDLGIDGSGETIVVFGSDGHTQEQLDAYQKRFNLAPFDVRTASGGCKAPTPTEKSGEEPMDIEVVHAIAPGARIMVYPSHVENKACTENTLATMQRIVMENPGAIQTHSWGACEDGPGYNEADRNAWKEVTSLAGSLSETVFVSSGDSGGLDCFSYEDYGRPPQASLGVALPASLPFVVAVGGTRLSVRADGTYLNETVWTQPIRTYGSTGGISRVFPAGTWQDGPGARACWPATAAVLADPAGTQHCYDGHRMVPDVSAVADGSTGVVVIDGSGWSQGGGTSQSAPIWAGITALMNHYLKSKGLKPVGFVAPALYAVGAGPAQFQPAFHDVTIGRNLVYPAGSGYDLATGLGTPHVWNLVRDLEALQRQESRQ